MSGFVMSEQGGICTSYLSHVGKGVFFFWFCFFFCSKLLLKHKSWRAGGQVHSSLLFSKITGTRHSSISSTDINQRKGETGQ